MNRKQKLIISITGITIVMLALLGLTYGYYLTRIQGNTNSNSISITTADLTLKYDDGSSYINLTNIMPGTITDGEDGNPLPKVFTVTNDGSGDVEYSIGMDEVTNTLTRTKDLTYSITCQEKLIDAADTAYTACATTPSNSGEYPKTNSYLFTNQIKQDYIQKYTVIISYANPDEDQSIDMGSTIKGRMQIYSVPESIDITGTVTGASSGDYVQINSEPKTSVIASDGTYKLIGVEPGTHTLKVMNGSTTKGTKEIVVKQGTDAGISDNTITFTENERVATVNITSIATNLGVNITEIINENKVVFEFPDYDTSINDASTPTEVGTIWTTGSGTESDPYLINSLDNLKYLAYKVNTGNKYKGVYFALASNIDCNHDACYIPVIGNNPNNYFDGKFDGGGHRLLNFGVSTEFNFTGLFGIVGPNAKISNINFENMSSISDGAFVGIVAGYNYGEITNITLENSSTISESDYVGGIAGVNYGTIEGNIKMGNSIISGNNYVGGIVGYNYGSVSDVTNIGGILEANDYVGYIIGYNYGTLSNASVENVTTESTGEYIGGNIGYDTTSD